MLLLFFTSSFSLFLVVVAAHQWHFVNFAIMILFICNSEQLSPFFTGAYYFDNTSQKEKEDDKVLPNSEHVYYWEVTSDVAPQKNDPTCLTYTYVSHQNVVKDYNSGLIGTLLICKQGNYENALVLFVFLHCFQNFDRSLFFFLSGQAVQMNQGSRLASTTSMYFFSGFLMRAGANTSLPAIPQTTM